jgi:hypothetical protein
MSAVTVAVHAQADPLGPPSHKLVVALVEPDTRDAAPLNLTLRITPTQDTGVIVIAAYQPKGKRRLLNDGGGSYYIEARHGGLYPSIAVNGTEQLPPCPAAALCSIPRLPTAAENQYDVTTAHFLPRDKRSRFYVFMNDVDVKLAANTGWRVHDVKGGALLQYRDNGTETRVSAEDRQYMVEDFRGVSAPRVKGPSVAYASLPCWPYPLPGGSGRAVLRNDGHAPGQFRYMDCGTYQWGALGASDTPTLWRNDGASLGWSGGAINRLVVAVLPPA